MSFVAVAGRSAPSPARNKARSAAAPSHVRGQAMQRLFSALYPCIPEKHAIDAQASANRLSGGADMRWRGGAFGTSIPRRGQAPTVRAPPAPRLSPAAEQVVLVL